MKKSLRQSTDSLPLPHREFAESLRTCCANPRRNRLIEARSTKLPCHFPCTREFDYRATCIQKIGKPGNSSACRDASALARPAEPRRRVCSPRQRIRPHLEMHHLGRVLLAALDAEPGAVAGVRPHAAAFPAGVGVVDAAVKAPGPEAHRTRDGHVARLAVHPRRQRALLVARCKWHLL